LRPTSRRDLAKAAERNSFPVPEHPGRLGAI
jgi:hypothetical protein